MKKTFAIALRVFTLGSRFGLTLMMAAYLQPSEAGYFGMYWAAIVLASGLLGLDVYAYSTRAFLAAKEREIIKKHSGFVGISTLLLVPCTALLFFVSARDTPPYLLMLFPVHLALEFIAQEVGRFLVVNNKNFEANVVLFVRTAVWVPLCLLWIKIFPGDGIKAFVVSWLIGSIGAIVLSRIYEPVFFTRKALSVDFSWIKLAIKGSLVLFASTLLFRAILGLDKFIVNAALGVESAGIYAVHASIALGVLSLTEAGVSAWRYPKLVTAIQQRNMKSIQILFKTFQREATVSSLAIGLIAIFLVPPLLNYVGHSQYTESMLDFYMIVFGTVAYSASMPSHYVIYGLKKDKLLLGIYLIGVAGLLLAALTLLKPWGLLGAGLMLCVALTSLALCRFAASYFLFRTLRSELSIQS